MSDTEAATEAFASHDAFERTGDSFALTTTAFDVQVAAVEGDYEVRITVPTLDAATDDHVADVIEDGWFETLCLRLEDAPDATRADVSVPEPTVERADDTVRIEFEFTHDDPVGAAEAAKTLAEYVEGTYVGGIVPGYSYTSPVAGLISRARQHGDDGGDEGERGPMPL